MNRRLQNRESAVRSRTKKREELDRLEQHIKKLVQQKAVIEAENAVLRIKNNYYEDLYVKQQNQLLDVPKHPEYTQYLIGNQANQGEQLTFFKADSY